MPCTLEPKDTPLSTPDLHLLEAPPPEERRDEPPQDRSAEMAVLGSLLADPKTHAEVTAILEPRDFYLPRHEIIYATIVQAYQDLDPADPIAIADRLRATGVLKRAGGAAYLHQLAQGVPITTNATFYADIVKERATMRRLLEAGTRIVQMATAEGEGDAHDIVARASLEVLRVAESAVNTDDPVVHAWEPYDLTEILIVGDNPEQPTVLARADGVCLFYPGAFHSVAGEPESGKSWIADLACAQELKAGADCTYVDFEDRAGRVVGRLLALGVPPERIAQRFHYIRPMSPLDPVGRAHLDKAAASSSLVVLDGVTEAMTLHGLSIDAQDDAAKFIHMFPKRLADLGPAVVQIDHVVKNADAQGRFAIGAQHKLAGLDGAAYIVKVIEPFARGKLGRARISISKDREGAVREQANGHTIGELVIDSTGPTLVVTIEPPHTTSRSDDGSFRPTILMDRCSRFLESNPGSSGKQVEAGVSGKQTAKRDALRILVLEGYVTSENGPRGAILYTSVNPFREDNA